MLGCQPIVDRVAGAVDGRGEPARIFQRSLRRSDQGASAVKVPRDIAARGIHGRDTPSPNVAEFVLYRAEFVGQWKALGDEALIGLAQSVMTARDGHRPERVVPE